MIQFNLLPDVKLQFVKAQRTKRLVMGSALIATAATFAIFMLLFLGVNVVQKVRTSQLDDDIKAKTKQLKSNEELDKVLTIQSQMASLNGLHDDKVAAGRVFSVIQQVTPQGVTISNFLTDFSQSTMSITGQAPSLDRVNAFVDTLKFSTYTQDGAASEGEKAFSEIVLSQFGRSDTGSSYTIALTFDPLLFSQEANNRLVVPKQQTTNSAVDQPTLLFQRQENPGQSPAENNGQGN